jgi:hypothetical protein
LGEQIAAMRRRLLAARDLQFQVAADLPHVRSPPVRFDRTPGMSGEGDAVQ